MIPELPGIIPTAGCFGQHAEEKFRLAVGSAPNGIALVDEEGRIQLVNRETERLFGYGRPIRVPGSQRSGL